MRVLLATTIDEPWSRTLLGELHALALADRFGVHEVVTAAADAEIVLFVDLHQFPESAADPLLRSHPLVRARPKTVFVYDERDVPRDVLPGLYVAMPGSRFDPRRHRAFGYYRLVADTRSVREAAPELLFSFQGRRAGPVRGRVLELEDPRAVLVDTSALDFFGADSGSLAEARSCYAELIGRSKFVLCPRGAGTSSIRLFETLAAGRVPVIVSDDWVEPAGFDWAACSVRVRERDVSSIGERLRAAEADWPALAAAAAGVYDEWFAPDVWFHRAVELCREILETGEPGIARRRVGWRGAARRLAGRM